MKFLFMFDSKSFYNRIKLSQYGVKEYSTIDTDFSTFMRKREEKKGGIRMEAKGKGWVRFYDREKIDKIILSFPLVLLYSSPWDDLDVILTEVLPCFLLLY